MFAAACGIRLHIDYCPFGQFYQWALQLGTKGPHFDALLVLVEQEALAPVGTDGPLERAKVAEAALTELLSVVRERVAAPVLVANFASCPVPVPGPVPGPSPGTAPGSGPVPGAGRDALADVLNSRLERLAQAAGVQVVDRSRVALELGGAWADERMRQMASLAFSHQGAIALARELTGHLVALTGLTKKCLVLDLDGTLWGGVLGEDGPEGIALGPGSVGGEAFAAFQWAVLELQARGVIVAVCSKNNEPEALGCMESHPHMALRPAHLAAWRINWETKAANLRAIAADLNIGVDSMVFLDDNPAEIELMRQQLPEVTSLRVPEDPALLPGFLRGLPLFRSLSSTTEDALRARDYVAQRQRAELQAETPSLDRYYASLDMSATVWAMREADVPRVAQVFARTNQFNLTGVRYSESEAQAMLQAGGARCYCLSLTDRFGESGLVGAAALRFTEDGEALIENLVLSCRVMGRTVERSFVAYLAEQARAMGSTKLVGRFVPTQRNQPAEGLYSGLGFTERARTAPGGESAGVEVRAGVDTGAGVAGGAGVASGAGVVTWEADLRVEPLLPSPFVPLVR